MQDMLDRANRIERYLEGKTEVDFFADLMVQDAGLRNVEVLGEAARQILDALPDASIRFPAVPFRTMYLTRNRLIHGYDSLRLSTVWELASRDIPPLRSALESILSNWPKDLS